MKRECEKLGRGIITLPGGYFLHRSIRHLKLPFSL